MAHFLKFFSVFLLAQPLFSQQTERYEFSHPQMGTTFRLVFFAEKDDPTAARIARLVFDRVDSLNQILSDYLPESETNRLAATAGTGQKTEISDDLWQILRLSVHFSKKSGGAFDATCGNFSKIWRRARRSGELPDPSKIEEARRRSGYQNISFFKKNRSVRLEKTGLLLDFGGIGQGYAADECLKILKKNGILRALADAGGDIAIGDPPPGKTGWKIEIPSENGQKNTVSLKNCGITTSGATVRFFEFGGKKYSHIFDPRTGWAMTHSLLVTVQAKNAVTADAWATAISVLGKTGFENLRERPRHLKVIFSTTSENHP